MTPTPTPLPAIADWLAREIAAVEAQLQRQGASCTLDRQRASSSDLKYDEGQYVGLRRARRLVERGESLHALHADAEQARAFLAGDGAPSADRQWRAYQQGVLDAVQAVLARVGSDGAAHDPACSSAPPSRRG